MRSSLPPPNAGPRSQFLVSALVVVVVFAAAIVALRTVGDATGVWPGVARLLGWVAAGMCVFYLIVLPFLVMFRQRDYLLANERPDSYVRGVMNFSRTSAAVRKLGWDPMPYTMSLRADDSGIELWGFSFRKPDLIKSLPWSSIGVITTAAVPTFGGAQYSCIVVPVVDPNAEAVEMPFAVLGNRSGGVGGAFMSDAARVAAELNRYRLARFSPLS